MTTKVEPLGVINSYELYTIQQFKKQLGISNTAFRTMRQEGLKVIRLGKRAYLSGRLAMEFLEGLAKEERVADER